MNLFFGYPVCYLAEILANYWIFLIAVAIVNLFQLDASVIFLKIYFISIFCIFLFFI